MEILIPVAALVAIGIAIYAYHTKAKSSGTGGGKRDEGKQRPK